MGKYYDSTPSHTRNNFYHQITKNHHIFFLSPKARVHQRILTIKNRSITFTVSLCILQWPHIDVDSVCVCIKLRDKRKSFSPCHQGQNAPKQFNILKMQHSIFNITMYAQWPHIDADFAYVHIIHTFYRKQMWQFVLELLR